MTNREKYNDELMAIWESGWQFSVKKENNTVRKCSTVVCDGCLFCAADTCINQRKEWLKQEYIEPVKTVKASELAVDTVVLCSRKKNEERRRRKFATVFKGCLYAQSGYRESELIYWEYMWLEDGTVVLPE